MICSDYFIKQSQDLDEISYLYLHVVRMFLPKTIGIRSTVGSQKPFEAGCKTENCEELTVLEKNKTSFFLNRNEK